MAKNVAWIIFPFQRRYVFSFVKIVLSAEDIVNVGADLPLNIKKRTVAYVPAIHNAANIIADSVPELPMSNELNITATASQQLNNTNAIVAQISSQNIPDVTATQEPGLSVTNITIVPSKIADIQSSRMNVSNVNDILETQNAINILAIPSSGVPGLNITNGADSYLIPGTQNTTTQVFTNTTDSLIPTVYGEPVLINISTVAEADIPGTDISNASMVASFVKSALVPDLIPVAPKHLLNVVFAGGRNVTLGNKLAPTQVKDIPQVSWNANPNHFYALIVVDPDQPSRKKPIFRSILHWCVVNIPGDDVVSGETLTEYIGAGPPEHSGIHRLTFLVYRQPGIICFDEIKLSNATSYGRSGFLVSGFALKYKLGNPIAGNFYKTFYDHYVPILYTMLGISHGNALTPGKIAIASLVYVSYWGIGKYYFIILGLN